MRIHALAVVAISLGLAACQSAGTGKPGYFSNPVEVGTALEVVEVLRVPAGSARVYLQGGEVSRYEHIDQYQPFCYFLMHKPSPVARDIRPATFNVRSVELREQDVRLATPLRVAHRGVFGSGDGPGVIAFETHMLLDITGQADPERLVCSGAFAPPMEAAPVRLDEMRQALGKKVVVRAPGSAGS
ncbi:hypothetical protein DFR30_0475 [Thiogranum longum]|uniref:Lipoprotein n=1 Tax=Thiogranum longum TaxID=1537524 RepID=A0A4R1HJ58_9GAMM|nr:hypothetical protein [Thiogranum longum]TCK17252.1 hypothetical protein DFR30_0475 [Thiogranum longum]